MVASLADLRGAVASFRYTTPRGKDPAESIYLFDQEAARSGIAYHAEFGCGPSRWPAFSIWVSEKDKDATQQIIDHLNPKYQPQRTGRFSGYWSEVEPARLSGAYQDHPWVFAVYRESSSQRDDGLSYVAFLFRNEERTVFGVKEWLGKDILVRNDVLEKMAHQVVTDRAFRNSLVSNDPDLPMLWKKR
jgi:hypothetical protein